MNPAEEIMTNARNLDALLVATPLDQRVRKVVVDAITLLRIAAEMQSKIENDETNLL